MYSKKIFKHTSLLEKRFAQSWKKNRFLTAKPGGFLGYMQFFRKKI